MGTNPLIDARDLVAELFPQARWVVLNGSMRPSAGSDLDLMVLLPDGDPRAPRDESRRFRGRPVELFVHDVPSLDRQLAWELSVRKPFLYRIVTTGATVVGEPHAWRERYSAGARLLTARRSVSTPVRPSGPGRGARLSRVRKLRQRRVWTAIQ